VEPDARMGVVEEIKAKPARSKPVAIPSPRSSSIAPARSLSRCAATTPARTRWKTRAARPTPHEAFALRLLPTLSGLPIMTLVVRQQVTLPNVIAIPGGLPIKVGDDVIGGAGVSGSPGLTSPVFRPGSTKLQISSNEPIRRAASLLSRPYPRVNAR